MNIDAAKTRRESLRWYIIKTLDTSRPVDPHEAVVLSTIQGIYPDATTWTSPPQINRAMAAFSSSAKSAWNAASSITTTP